MWQCKAPSKGLQVIIQKPPLHAIMTAVKVCPVCLYEENLIISGVAPLFPGELAASDFGLLPGTTNSASRLLTSARSQHRRSHPWQRSWGRDLTDKGKSGLEGPPGPAWASTLKPESVCLTISCLSPTLPTLTGGYPWPPFSKENQLRALVNKSPGHNRVFQSKSPDGFLACLTSLFRLLQLSMWLFTASQPWEAWEA